jgi:hypothetical protein
VSKESGFLQLRRGVFKHVRDGRMSLFDYAIHSYITSQADTRTGIWMGSAGALAGELSLSPRQARRLLERLSQGDYIKRFPVPGKHVCYPILVHKFAVTDGEHKGEQLNAIASTSPVDLRYFSGEHGGEHVSLQKILETRNRKQETKPNANPKATSRFALPDWIPLETWNDFLEMRKSLRSSPTEKGKALLVGKLQKLKSEGQDPKAVLERSIERSWKGVFAVKESRRGKPDASTIEARNLAAAGFRPN